MKTLKLITFLLGKFIRKNPGTSITTLIMLLSFSFAGTFDRYETSISPISVTKYGKEYIYIYRTSDSYNTKTFDTKQKVINGKIYYTEYHIINILLWVVFAFTLIALIVIFISSECDYPSKTDFYLKHVECITESNMYYYRIDGRLIMESNKLEREYELESRLRAYLLNKNIFPIWKSKVEKRLEATKDI